LLATIAGPGEEVVMFVKHCEVGATCRCTLLVIRASSAGPDGGSNLGDGIPLANVAAPIIFDGFEAISDTFVLDGWFVLISIFGHELRWERSEMYHEKIGARGVPPQEFVE